MHLDLLKHQTAGEVILAVAIAGGCVWYARTRVKPTAEEIEHARREHLARSGRITDGVLIDALGTQVLVAPEGVLFYRYRVGGVEYECAQNVAELVAQTRDVRVDRPVQVRYNARNPGDSIVVSESWNGLQSGSVLRRQG